MEFTARQIADFLKGEIEGDQEVTVHTISKIEEATAGSLTFLANPAYTPWIYKTGASIVLVNKDFKPESPVNSTLIKVDNAYNALAGLLNLYQQSLPQKQGVSSLASLADSSIPGKNNYIGEFVVVGENVTLGENVKIYPHCFIGDNVVIKDNSTLYAGVKVYDNCVIGRECSIHSGAVIGADGFGFAPQSDNNYMKIAQIGNVILEDHVEIGANTTIDRATMGSTVIKKGVKLDNLIQVAHNVVVGENTVIAAQTGIAGSSKVGKNCMIGGQVGISGHLSIGDEVKIAAQSGLSSNVKNGKIIMGSPAFEHDKYIKAYIHFRNLEKLVKRIDDLEKQVNTLTDRSL
ncbi:MAG: UDP-3-O-(3-hydroxymyristoyl)glucosamine N-acyltransferase [Bacteroidetes bacterium]|nr:MAG: UDP-3-O-(3-hydroxymyristoyl)glucosamine N-acyltransferase [Bacteroidota bacterium]